MKTDRELLVLAAKAAGVAGSFVEKTPEDGYPRYSCGISSGPLVFWNPLTDDGDALRLAVKLDLQLGSYSHADIAGMSWAESQKEDVYCVEPHCDDAAGRTRRVIVRVAAAIGEAML